MGNNYRTSNMIIQNILESLLDDQPGEGVVKSHLIEICGLKTSTAEKYLNKMESAGYIACFEESWGKERMKIRYNITELGKTRYEWFVKINSELLEDE
ncbi:MAG: hypothetical protein JW776_11040 [Candidatus Lokiarchaeota archaeon]|nr:hypothetical protein [Candidatus Lokiarchaeota archaeon]